MIARGQAPEEPIALPSPPPPVRELVGLPAPEQLGLAPTRNSEPGIDWNAVNQRVQNLGAVCFQQTKLPQGRWRVTCLLPTNQPNQTHRIEVEADSNAEGVRLALAQAEEWSGVKK
jgi:hypothetical protein